MPDKESSATPLWKKLGLKPGNARSIDENWQALRFVYRLEDRG